MVRNYLFRNTNMNFKIKQYGMGGLTFKKIM